MNVDIEVSNFEKKKKARIKFLHRLVLGKDLEFLHASAGRVRLLMKVF